MISVKPEDLTLGTLIACELWNWGSSLVSLALGEGMQRLSPLL